MEASEVPARWAELYQRLREGEAVTVREAGREVARMSRSEDEAMARLRELEAEGKATIPPRFGERGKYDPVRAVDGGYVGAVEAVIEERRSGR